MTGVSVVWPTGPTDNENESENRSVGRCGIVLFSRLRFSSAGWVDIIANMGITWAESLPCYRLSLIVYNDLDLEGDRKAAVAVYGHNPDIRLLDTPSQVLLNRPVWADTPCRFRVI